jgi:hypothetical protein
MPDANPPKSYRTSDNIEWTFLQTFQDYDQMQKFRQKNKFQSRAGDEKFRRIRYFCIRINKNNCKFMLLAFKTTKERYHVYKHGKHNSHMVQTSKQYFYVNSEDRLLAFLTTINSYFSKNMNHIFKEIQNQQNANEKVMCDEEDENEVGGIEDDKEQEHQPPRKITRSIRGRKQKYCYLKTVKSVEELDQLRLKVIAKMHNVQ